MSAPKGGLERAVVGLALDVNRRMRERDAREAQIRLEEQEVQYHVSISGTAAPVVGFALTTIEFDVDFFYAPGQRDSDLTYPTLSVGAEANANVAFTATVREWTVDAENGAVTGAVVAIGFLASAAGTAFTGQVHLTFQGWGGLREPDADLG